MSDNKAKILIKVLLILCLKLKLFLVDVRLFEGLNKEQKCKKKKQ